MDITLLDGGMGQELCNRSSNPIHAEWGGWVMRHEPHLVQGRTRTTCAPAHG